MRTSTLVILFFVSTLALGSCIVAIGPGATHSSWGWGGKRGSNVSATQTRAVQDFHAIRIEGSCDVNATVGGAQSVAITADDNLIDDLVTEVKDGVLVITMRDGANDNFRVGPKAAISVPSLDSLMIEGSGDAVVTGVSGENFKAHIEGSGDMRVSGKATKLELGIEGSGDADLSGLDSRDVSVSIDGSGDARVRCSGSLNASVSGSGDIGYIGSPHTSISISGSGDVRPIHG
jgi:hypothetical protein